MRKVNEAFTLLEIMIVMVVIVFMATIIGPWLTGKKPKSEWPVVLSEFNDLVAFARQEAIANQEIYRLFFQANKKEQDFVLVEKEGSDPEKPEQKIYNQVFSDYLKTKYELPENIKMNTFYEGKVEKFEENKGQGYCYIVPTGLVQDIMIHLTRKIGDRESKVTFKMSPFFGRFELYEGFLKHEK